MKIVGNLLVISKDKLNNKAEITKIYERLKGLFLNENESKLPLVDKLLMKCAFVVVELKELEADIKKNGIIQASKKQGKQKN